MHACKFYLICTPVTYAQIFAVSRLERFKKQVDGEGGAANHSGAYICMCRKFAPSETGYYSNPEVVQTVTRESVDLIFFFKTCLHVWVKCK